MSLDQPIAWAAGHPWHAAALAGVLTALCVVIAHRTSGAVLSAGIGALICTAYSGDTSWGFAEHRLGMVDVDERAVMFAAGEGALLACAIMARANKKATATDTAAGTPGVAGVLVWCITGIQIIPAYSESGFWGGTVRAVIGPVMASMLWHLAMGLEIRVSRPEALSTGLPAQIAHELRERLLSRLGLAVRGRTAEQVSRDRATARAVRLASRKHLGWWGRAALKASVARSGAAVNGDQRHQLLQLLAARRGAAELRTVPVVSPWVEQALPEPYPPTPLGVTGAELRRMDPMDAVLHVHTARPGATPAELASLLGEYGVPVSEAQVRVALHAVPTRPTPSVPSSPAATPQLFATPAPPALHSTALAAPVPDPDDVPWPEDEPTPEEVRWLDDEPEPDGALYPRPGLRLDVATEPQVRPEVACAIPAESIRRRPGRSEVHARVPDPEAVPAQVDPTGTSEWERLLARAREVDAAHRSRHGRPASVQALKNTLHIGQTKAQLVRDTLRDGPAS
ncbi:hypothetical protein ACIP3A_03780 [Streptomyces tricolor]|uniref:hypothetical protein n=1 Tax=Streptomyces tricolor TaxID=68277 RepID=UPI0037F4FCD4